MHQTHIAIGDQPREQLAAIADTLYNASTLEQQPWYPQFLDGASQSINDAKPLGIEQHQLALGKLLMEGKGVVQDDAAALQWLCRCRHSEGGRGRKL